MSWKNWAGFQIQLGFRPIHGKITRKKAILPNNDLTLILCWERSNVVTSGRRIKYHSPTLIKTLLFTLHQSSSLCLMWRKKYANFWLTLCKRGKVIIPIIACLIVPKEKEPMHLWSYSAMYILKFFFHPFLSNFHSHQNKPCNVTTKIVLRKFTPLVQKLLITWLTGSRFYVNLHKSVSYNSSFLLKKPKIGKIGKTKKQKKIFIMHFTFV